MNPSAVNPPVNLPPSVHRPRRQLTGLFASMLVANFSLAGSLLADQHTGNVPQYSSNPGAAYTIYLDVAGFNYSGTWYPASGTTYTPGSTPAVNDIANTANFSAADVTQINNIYTRLAQSYIGFNVNVTTVDPAVTAGMGSTDALRQAFYDATPNLMHTVVGSQIRPVGTPGTTPGNKWFSDGADGVSPGIGVAAGNAPATSGNHTNWMFSEAQAGAATGGTINGDYIGAISAHENGHSFGLYHQGDFVGASPDPVNEYTFGDANANRTTPGSYVAIMGNADDRQRIAFRVGDSHPDGQVVQNDVRLLLSTNTAAAAAAAGRTGGADLHLVNDGIGHSVATATGLALKADGTVDFSLAKGVIVPISEMGPQPKDAVNYTTDHFKFTLSSSTEITLTAHDSTELLIAGVADGTGTLRSTLSIYMANGTMLGGLVGTATEALDTLSETFSGLLAGGDYYALVRSFGGHDQVNDSTPGFNASTYYDMGAFFLTGSGFQAVPEPSTWVLMLLGGGGILGVVRRRRSRRLA